MSERINLVDREPEQVQRMQRALRETLDQVQAPPEQLERLGLVDV